MKTILITGASRGIGRATVEKFLKEGWSVIGTATGGKIDIENPNLTVIPLDYLKPKSVERAGATVAALKRKIDVLVNNSGIAEEENGNGIDVAILRKTLEINLIGAVDLTNRLLLLLSDGAHIVNISSQAAGLTDFEPMRWVVPSYKISKAALNMYTKTLAEMLKERGISVSSLDPGWVRTEMGGEDAPRDPKEAAEDIYHLVTSAKESGQFWSRGKKRSW